MLRAGLIGHGVVGRRREAAILAHPELELVGVSDSAEQTAALLDQALDLVFVCVPNDQAAPCCLQALARDLHVFCEKPPARSCAELLPVVRAAEQGGRVLMYGFNHRLHGSVRRLLGLAASGELGPLHGLRGVYGKPGSGPFSNRGWRTDPAVAGGGILLDQGIHLLDLMLLLAPDLQLHSALARGSPLEDEVHALLRSPEVVAHLHSSAREHRCTFRLEALFAGARVVLDGILSGSMAYAPEVLRCERPGQDPVVEEWRADRSWAEEVAIMARSVVDGTTAAHGAPSDAVRIMRLIERIYEVGRA